MFAVRSILLVAAASFAAPAAAVVYEPDGGVFHPRSDYVFRLPDFADVSFEAVRIPKGVTVSFAGDGPVSWNVVGDFSLEGTLYVGARAFSLAVAGNSSLHGDFEPTEPRRVPTGRPDPLLGSPAGSGTITIIHPDGGQGSSGGAVYWISSSTGQLEDSPMVTNGGPIVITAANSLVGTASIVTAGGLSVGPRTLVASSAPEPSSWTLIGVGAAALALRVAGRRAPASR